MPTPSLLQDVLRQRLEAVEDAQLQAADGPNASIVVSDDGLDVHQVLTPPESDEDDPIDVVRALCLRLEPIVLTHCFYPALLINRKLCR